ncbi:Hint domain-containing protein [Brucella sp. NBRC 12950]|uniref:Hint domain-containing protein n=1 Tax=Brucella sp. NBRC 12950 TaxID=2994518 RepID=UPI002555B2C4|nr:Hint domain-containing protein [Brucella sp. NBRC 12950]
MPSDNYPHSPRNRARRHFLGAAAGMAAKAAALGALASSLSSLPARALGTKWWEHGGGSGTNCFLRGTLIDTAKGPVPVETLEIGDLVKTVRGEALPVRWIGWQCLVSSGAQWNENIMPIRIKRHALGGELPRRDLMLSPNHALFIDGVLIRVKDLVNAHSIARISEDDAIDYYNIVLDSHEVVFAEGVAVETYLMQGENYLSFTNFAEYQQLYAGQPSVTMTPFAPIMGYEGAREHIRALLCMSGVLPIRDIVEETYQKLASASVQKSISIVGGPLLSSRSHGA